MKNLTKTTLGFVAVLFISLTFIQCKDAKDAAITKFLELQAEQVNKQCPMDMGGITLKECKVAEGKTLKYIFVVESLPEGFDPATNKAAVVQTLKNAPEFKQMEEFEVSFLYLYYDKEEKLLGEVKITPEDFK